MNRRRESVTQEPRSKRLVPAPVNLRWNTETGSIAAEESERKVKSFRNIDMLACLGRFDGKRLDSMDSENHWHDDFMVRTGWDCVRLVVSKASATTIKGHLYLLSSLIEVSTELPHFVQK
ncbi:hypothetical protein OH492_17125 [Vibrio chagasii]|nr:hypothetical protein [Vibrio chagasii]